MKLEAGPQNALNIHVTLVPYIATAGELKTKPTQHSVKEMREIGIQPDVLLCRTQMPLSRGVKEKIALFSNVAVEAVIGAIDVVVHLRGAARCSTPRASTSSSPSASTSGAAPPDLARVAAHRRALQEARRAARSRSASSASTSTSRTRTSRCTRRSSTAALANDCKVELEYIDSEQIEQEGAERRCSASLDAVLVPGGFGDRGTEGKIAAIGYARDQAIPFFGICLGMQLAVVEFARNVAGLAGANSSEFDKDTPAPRHRPDARAAGRAQQGRHDAPRRVPLRARAGLARGRGVRRDRDQRAPPPSLRVRQRLPRPARRSRASSSSGTSPDKRLVEMVELPRSPVLRRLPVPPRVQEPARARPHPLFARFVRAALERQAARAQGRRAESDRRATRESQLAFSGLHLPTSRPRFLAISRACVAASVQ